MRGILYAKDVDQMSSDELLNELEKKLLPKMPSVEGGWRLLIDVYGQVTLAQVSTRLIHLALNQRDRIEKLEDEIAKMKKQIASIVKE